MFLRLAKTRVDIVSLSLSIQYIVTLCCKFLMLQRQGRLYCNDLPLDCIYLRNYHKYAQFMPAYNYVTVLQQ